MFHERREDRYSKHSFLASHGLSMQYASKAISVFTLLFLCEATAEVFTLGLNERGFRTERGKKQINVDEIHMSPRHSHLFF